MEVERNGCVQTDTSVVVHDHTGRPRADTHFPLTLRQLLLPEGHVPPVRKGGGGGWRKGLGAVKT